MTENKKFVDDLTILEDVQLKDNVVEKHPLFVPYHERHGLRLLAEVTILQHKLKALQYFVQNTLI